MRSAKYYKSRKIKVIMELEIPLLLFTLIFKVLVICHSNNRYYRIYVYVKTIFSLFSYFMEFANLKYESFYFKPLNVVHEVVEVIQSNNWTTVLGITLGVGLLGIVAYNYFFRGGNHPAEDHLPPDGRNPQPPIADQPIVQPPAVPDELLPGPVLDNHDCMAQVPAVKLNDAMIFQALNQPIVPRDEPLPGPVLENIIDNIAPIVPVIQEQLLMLMALVPYHVIPLGVPAGVLMYIRRARTLPGGTPDTPTPIIRRTRKQRPQPAPLPPEAITTRPEVFPILGEDVPFPIETMTTLNEIPIANHDTRDTRNLEIRRTRRQGPPELQSRITSASTMEIPDARQTPLPPEAITPPEVLPREDPTETMPAVESLMTQPSEVPIANHDTRETPTRSHHRQTPEAVTPQSSTEAQLPPQSSTSTTNTHTKSAKRKLKEHEKAKAKVEAEALAKAEAEAKKVKEAEKGKSKETSTASRDLSLDPNNNNNQATSSTAKDRDTVRRLWKISDDANKITLDKLDLQIEDLKVSLKMELEPRPGLRHPTWRLWLLCNKARELLLMKPEKARLVLKKLKSLIAYRKVRQELSTVAFYTTHTPKDVQEFISNIESYPDTDILPFINDLLTRVPKLNCITVLELEKILAQLLHSTFPIRRG
jgi:hypothetical protein